jgi:putative DNA primase/helicase
MFAVSANTPGAGKGKVVDTIALIADGRPADKMAYTGDVAEDNRVILSHLMNQSPNVCLDNIPRGLPLASAAFESLLTAPSFGARVVGTSKFHRATFHDTLWSATGNGLTTAGDMARRTLRIDIEDRSGRPADREVSHLDLEEHVRRNRVALVRSVLVLLAGWSATRGDVAPVQLAPLASYDAWSSVVRQCVTWCGLPDPATAVGRADTDSVRSEREVLLQHLLPLQPILSSELSALLTKDPKFAEFRSFLLEQGVQVGSAVSIGKFLIAHLNEVTISGGERLVLHERRTNGGRRYSVMRLGPS